LREAFEREMERLKERLNSGDVAIQAKKFAQQRQKIRNARKAKL